MYEKSLAALALSLTLLVAGVALFWNPELPEPPAPAKPALPAGGDFTLQSAKGPVSLHDFRGKVALVYFGYTYCPDVCPTALYAVGDALRQLAPAEAEQVAVIFISVDPRRDSPEKLGLYTGFFHPNIVGVTGTDRQLAKVARDYGAHYALHADDEGDGDYVVDHSADIYVVAASGRVVDRIVHGATSDQIATTIRTSMTVR